MWQILLIEDDAAVAASLLDGLSQSGYGVTWRNTGAAGLEAARAGGMHLILLDVRLPDSSGFDVCRQLRTAGLKLPVIMLTVQRDEIDKVLGLEMGADDYVTKPFSLRELVARIRAQLRRAYGELLNPVDGAPGSADLLHAGDLTIDLGRIEVHRAAGRPLPLTPLEFKLLVCLARHPNAALSRAQILDEVWGYDADVESEQIVNVHIRRLREKVEIDPARPTLILTVPGVGYRLAG